MAPSPFVNLAGSSIERSDAANTLRARGSNVLSQTRSHLAYNTHQAPLLPPPAYSELPRGSFASSQSDSGMMDLGALLLFGSAGVKLNGDACTDKKPVTSDEETCPSSPSSASDSLDDMPFVPIRSTQLDSAASLPFLL